MTMTTHERDQLRKALGVYVDEAPPAPEWQDWDIAHASDPPKQSRMKGPMAALAAATIVLVVIGGVGLVTRPTPDSPPGGMGEEPLTWGDWFDAVVASGEPIGGDPTILQAALGPEPEFDTSALGEEQRLEPVTPDTIGIRWDFFGELPDDPNPLQIGRQMLVVAGQVESSVVGVGLFAESYVSGRTITNGLCQTVADVNPGVSAAIAGDCTEPTETVEYGKLIVLGMGDLRDVVVHVSAAFVVPPDTSVVAVDTAGTRRWQRPRGGIALFAGQFLAEDETAFTAYSASGDVLLQGTVDFVDLDIGRVRGFGSSEPAGAYAWGPLAVVSGAAGGDLALIAGTVRIADGCVLLNEQGADVLLVWPSESTLWNAETKVVSFETFDGGIVQLRDGDTVSLGGGGSSFEEGGQSAEEFLASVDWVAKPDASCVTDTRWFVNDVISAGSDS